MCGGGLVGGACYDCIDMSACKGVVVCLSTWLLHDTVGIPVKGRVTLCGAVVCSLWRVEGKGGGEGGKVEATRGRFAVYSNLFF